MVPGRASSRRCPLAPSALRVGGLLLLLAPACEYFPPSLLVPADAGQQAEVATLDLTGEHGEDGPAKLDGPLKPDGPLKLDGPLTPDAPQTLDQGPLAPACATGATAGQTYAANMIVCVGTTQLNQCSAGPLCNAAGGWSLCSASQFLARGGKGTATIKRAWLASCVRDNAAPASPTNAICSICMGTNIGAVGVGWRCTGTQSDNKSTAYVGVASFTDCRRPGANLAANEGYWHPFDSAATVDAAVCCH